jgi:transposase
MDGPDLGFLHTVGGEAKPTPYSTVFVTLTKQEHIELVWAAKFWKMEHGRAAERALRIEAVFEQRLRRAGELAGQREAALLGELETAQAKIRDLQQRLFGRKSERRWIIDDQHRRGAVGRRARGQQRGAAGHGRTRPDQLPIRVEDVGLDSPVCPGCGQPLSSFAGTDECEVLEVEVRAYRRLIRRQRYRRTCRCEDVAGVVTAPPPARLIPRGKFGVSVWVSVLLDKFLYGRPSYRLVQDLADQGLALSMGSLTGGLQAIAPLFVPLKAALLGKLREEPHWHADETRWEVFVEIEGKSGHRWYLWVFQSRSVAYYEIDESRSSAVPSAVLAGVAGGTISCDRFGAYKKFARLHPGFTLAFCWAHQRRDLLDLANGYPQLAPWALAWVQCIGDLFALHAGRREAPPNSPQWADLDRRLRATVREMLDKREAALADPTLPPPAVKLLQSMREHWAGLTVFVDRPTLPMDNNAAERALRPAVIGRKNFYGSGSFWSGELAATMFSVLMTMRRWQINPRTWLGAYLHACAHNGNRPPPDLRAFVPWTMDAAQLAAMRAAPCSAGTAANHFPDADTS